MARSTANSTITPSRQQYLDIKAQHQDAIVFFRLGDFYETFDDDAHLAAKELDLVLTSRPQGKNIRTPMAGVPHHAAESYIARLIAKGYKVALCEQVSSTQINGLMPREVVRVFTAGTVIEPGMLDAGRNNYLTAVFSQDDRYGLAYADITTGEFATTQVNGRRVLIEELARLSPAELLLPDHEQTLFNQAKTITPLPTWRFEEGSARQTLQRHFGVTTLSAFGCEQKPLAIQAAGAILAYLQETQKGAVGQIQRLATYSVEGYMALDTATRRNLELTESISGERAGSLLQVLNKCVTPMGTRLLRETVSRPLLNVDALNERLDRVETFHTDALLRADVRETLKGLPDLERLTNRTLSGQATPRDLEYIGLALTAVPKLAEQLENKKQKTENGKRGTGESLAALMRGLDTCPEVCDLISRAIAEDAPTNLNKMGVIKPGFSVELDGVMNSSKHAREWVANLEPYERERTGISSLKVGFNKVFGYYIEVTRANSHLVPDDYIRKQTLTSAERYITPELKEYETLILNAEDRILQIERRVFTEVMQQVATYAQRLLKTAQIVAQVDVAASLAETAANYGYTRPILTNENGLRIENGRHPVVEHSLSLERFVPNNSQFDEAERIQIITGPNMSGKCVTGNTLVFTNLGLLPLTALMPNDAREGEFSEINCQIQGKNGRRQVTHFYTGKPQHTIKIKTRLGYELEGTPEHRLWVRHPDGHESWKCLGEVVSGDTIAIDRQINLWGNQTAIDLTEVSALKNVIKHRLPKEITEDLAYIMGLLVGDGTLTYTDSLNLSTGDTFIAEEFKRISLKLFNYKVGCKTNGKDFTITSKQIRVFMAGLGLDYHRAHEKHLPASILRAPQPIIVSFLQGLFDADGFVENRYGNIRYSTSSKQMAKEVQVLLLNFGIIASLQVKKTTRRPNYRVSINGEDAIAFHQQIGFRLPRKKNRRDLHQSSVPCPELELVSANRYFYDPIVSIETSDSEVAVFDLSVADDHAYIANGFISHNSTYLRQVALITLMAQIGSYVPADEAEIGVVDRIFTRIGAHDELHAGRSTFMVEMVETAEILNHATHRSLLILDEIGRGTSTYDGLAIAWSIVEYLHNHPRLKPRTLFATHYHELTGLADILPMVTNYNVDVAEEGDKVVFLHQIVPGGADRSYGIHVGQLAGLPRDVINRANEILKELERHAPTTAVKTSRLNAGQQIALFPESSPVLDELTRLDVTAMTPMEAINKLYEWKRRFANE